MVSEPTEAFNKAQHPRPRVRCGFAQKQLPRNMETVCSKRTEGPAKVYMFTVMQLAGVGFAPL